MQPDSGMGINSRSAVGEVGAVMDPEMALRRNQSACATSNNTGNTAVKLTRAPRAVTERETSDTEMKGPLGSPSTDQESGTTDESRTQKRKPGTLVPGQHKKEGKQGSSGTIYDSRPSLPQHEQIQPVQPLDISYCATPQTLSLREVLMARLDASTLTGRIQVVSSTLTLFSFLR